jgi:hypothetical protein
VAGRHVLVDGQCGAPALDADGMRGAEVVLGRMEVGAAGESLPNLGALFMDGGAIVLGFVSPAT